MVCANCGVEFTPKPRSRPDTRFCHDNCRRASWGRGKTQSDPEYRERLHLKYVDYYYGLTGVQYGKLLLRHRREKARYRRASRESLGAHGAEGQKGD